MELFKKRVAGVDVHKKALAITVIISESENSFKVEQFESLTFTEDLIATGQKLLDMGVKHVAMESSGIYWKPLYNVWAPMGIHVTVGQAAHMKNVPGRKTDMNDSRWIAELHRFGLIRPSMIPEGSHQQLRLISRHRTNLVNDLARIKNRVQKTLEDGNIKWGSVASDVFGKSGVQILRLLADGVIDANTLSLAVTTKIKRKEDVRKSLTNCFTKRHCFLIKRLMAQYDHLNDEILAAERELSQLCEPHSGLIDELTNIPGISETLAQGIIGEATDNMDHFKDERRFAAWAGVAAGNNESGGKKKEQSAEKEIHISEDY